MRPEKLNWMGKTYMRVDKGKARQACEDYKRVILRGYAKKANVTFVMDPNYCSIPFDKVVEKFALITHNNQGMCKYFVEEP